MDFGQHLTTAYTKLCSASPKGDTIAAHQAFEGGRRRDDGSSSQFGSIVGLTATANYTAKLSKGQMTETPTHTPLGQFQIAIDNDNCVDGRAIKTFSQPVHKRMHNSSAW